MPSRASGALAAALLLAAPLALAARAQTSPAPPSTVATQEVFDPATSLTAPIALMLDIGSGRVLFSREPNRRFMPASLTKIMTAYTAFEMMDEGRLQPNQRLQVSDQAFEQWHRVGSTMFLGRAQVVSVDELLHGIMTVSANDGCIVLAEGASGSVPAFIARMNAEAAKLGMRDSRFGSPNGWPDQGATYTTAHDLALLTRAMLMRHRAKYRAYVGHAEMTFNNIRQENHVPLLGRVAGADGVKTGFTNEAGFGLVGSAVRNGRRIVMVVGGYDRAWQRARESRDFIEWGFSEWSAEQLFPAGAEIADVRVQDGASTRVAATAPTPYYLTLKRGERADAVRLTVRYRGPVPAPVRKGQQLGELVVEAPGQPQHALPLYAAHDVGDAGPLARLRNGLLGAIGL
jgi:D-alanyl-D-alanine carboxypeptidase (penicillin-binding protein 5/6)